MTRKRYQTYEEYRQALTEMPPCDYETLCDMEKKVFEINIKVVEAKIRMTERELQDSIVELAQTLGWRVAHFRPARVIKNGKETWRTAVSADGKGFPDLCLAREGHVIFAELKSERGKLSNEQAEWLSVLGGRCESYVWHPADWFNDTIMEVLK